MEKEFIPYEQALALRELGFDEELCFGRWTTYPDGKGFINTTNHFVYQIKDDLNRQCLAPLYQQVFRWFREKHNLTSSVSAIYKDENRINFEFWYYILQKEDEEIFYNTYEEAELACLNKLIEIIKNKQNEGINLYKSKKL